MPKGTQNGDTRKSHSSRASTDYHDWPLDSNFDSSRTIHSTSDLDDFMATLSGPSPLANILDQYKEDAQEMEAGIMEYLHGGKLDIREKCLLAQDILRFGIERSADLMDELYLQLLKHLRGNNKVTSVRGWELLLLAACAARPSSKFMEPVNNFVHSASHAKTPFPSAVSILAKRTWAALKHNSKPGSRVNVPSAGEIESVLSSKTMKVQISFVDGSNKWLFYDWTTTVSGAVEQLASQIGLKNYKEYTLFEVKKVPKKLDNDGYRSVATLPPDSYLLLEDDRRVAEVLQDYEARGAENKLLLKRKRFDTSDADFSKPQFIALTTAHQAAMDEKIAEVANLTLRLREMSGKVAWWEALQDEAATDLKRMTQRAEEAERRAKDLLLHGVSVETAEVIKERDALEARVAELEAAATAKASREAAEQAIEGDWNPVGLFRKILNQQEENEHLQAELQALRSVASPADVEKAAAAAGRNGDAAHGKADRASTEKEALYDLMKLQSDLEEDHKEELAARDEEIEQLKDMLAALANEPMSSQQSDAAGDAERTANGHSGALEGGDETLQAELQRLVAENAALEQQVETLKKQLKDKEAEVRGQDRDWRQQVNSARAEAAAVSSRLRSREAALAQASADVEELHKQTGQLKGELDDKSWELESTVAKLESAVQDRDAALAALEKLKASGAPAPLARSMSREAGAQQQLIADLTAQLDQMVLERDAAVEKLTGIQQLMFGAAPENGAAKGPERAGKARTINANCPLEIGKDPRRETVGGASVPLHLRGVAPPRVKPEVQDKRPGSRYPGYSSAYSTPAAEQWETKTVAATMMRESDARRRMFKQQSERPPTQPSTASMTEKINSGSHLLGLLSGAASTQSQDSDSILNSGGARDDTLGPQTPEFNRANSSVSDVRARRAALNS